MSLTSSGNEEVEGGGAICQPNLRGTVTVLYLEGQLGSHHLSAPSGQCEDPPFVGHTVGGQYEDPPAVGHTVGTV